MSGTTQTKIVGQKIKLKVRSNPVGHSVTDVEWTIPDKNVKDYRQSLSSATVTPLAAADRNSMTVTFFWIDGKSKAVLVKAKVDGTPKSASVTVNVLTPTDVTMTSVTGDVGVGPTGWAGDPPMNLYYGKSPKVGIQWTCKATAPAGGDGVIAATQITNSVRTITSNAGVTQSNDTGGTYMLDTTVPYNTAVSITAGASATWASNDSPSQGLTPDLQKSTANDLFRTYFMYKPNGDSIWVTLMRLDWHWAGATTRVGAPAGAGNNWTAPTGASSDTNPSGTASTELPTWTANVTSITWR